MQKTAEQTYTDLLRQLGAPTVVEPEVLVGYLRDVERLYSMGHITAWQLERARDAYADTLARDPRQDPASDFVPHLDADSEMSDLGNRHLDPISGMPGAHPLGTGVGAALGGAAAGAAIGTVVGPVGTAIGAAVGAVVGGLAGKGVAEAIDPTDEVAYRRTGSA